VDPQRRQRELPQQHIRILLRGGELPLQQRQLGAKVQEALLNRMVRPRVQKAIQQRPELRPLRLRSRLGRQDLQRLPLAQRIVTRLQ
jgi:hypothetical protein